MQEEELPDQTLGDLQFEFLFAMSEQSQICTMCMLQVVTIVWEFHQLYTLAGVSNSEIHHTADTLSL